MFFRDDKLSALKARVEAQDAELARLRAALAFYADADDATVFVDEAVTIIMEDKGRRARQALEDA